VFLTKYYDSAHVNHGTDEKDIILVGKSYDNIQHKVLDTGGRTILKLIQNIRDERLVWLDQGRVNTKGGKLAG
jgi:hypothetical protein